LDLQLLELTFSYFKLLVQIVALRRAIFVNLLAFRELIYPSTKLNDQSSSKL
jgi:hypothetical protein